MLSTKPEVVASGITVKTSVEELKKMLGGMFREELDVLDLGWLSRQGVSLAHKDDLKQQ